MASEWFFKYRRELDRGHRARQEGNEGMARVCARRAAGELVREYFHRHNIPVSSPSALNLLKILAQATEVSPRVREIATHFVWQITTEHILPGDVDLLAEIEWLEKELLGEDA